MSAMVASPEIYSAFLGSVAEQKTFYHGHTFGGNPLAAAASLASIDLLQEVDFVERRLPEKIEALRCQLEPLKGHANVADVRRLGMLAGVELAANPEAGTPFTADLRVGYRVCQAATQRGVWLRPLGDVVVVMPPLATTSEQFELLGQVLSDSVEQVCADVMQST
jgi:adenosylmethionine-8-amino-7-oxononanoate aminotransferase